MPPEVAALLCSCLLLFPPSARADLKVTVFPTVIQSKPGSDVELPCSVVDTLRPIDLKQLAVIWKIGSKVIAKYENIFEARRPGASMLAENLQKGNATLLLPGVQDSDAGLYTCEVIHETNQGEGNVQLKIEAAPSLTHGSTKVQLGVPSSVMCVASGFYPGDIFVTWLKDGETVKNREKVTAQLHRNGLYSAESTLAITPKIADVNSNISCKFDHKAIQQPRIEEFQLQVQAKPIVEVITLPPKEKNFFAAECQVSRFYPETIHVDWFQNGMEEETLKSQPQNMPDGTFSVKVLVLQKRGDRSLFTCRVQHESLDTPVRKEVLWLPKDPSVPSPILPWISGIVGLLLGLLVGGLVVTAYHKKKANHTTSPGGERKTLLPTAKENEPGASEGKAGKTGVGVHHKKDHPEQDGEKGHQNMSEVKTEEPPRDSVSVL